MSNKENTSLDKAKPAPATLADVLENRKEEILKMGGFSQTQVDSFIATALASVNTTPKLKSCSFDSVVLALYDAAKCGLSPNSITQEGHLVPFKGKCTFIVGYRGLLNMIMATRLYTKVNVQAVHANDEFFECQGTNPQIVHVPLKEGPRGDFIGAYAVLFPISGPAQHQYVSKSEAEEHRDRYCKSIHEGKIVGPWKENFPAMNMKTALRKVSKYTPTAPATAMLHMAIRFDEMQETGAIDIRKAKPSIKQPTALPDGQKMSDLKDQIEVMGAKAEGEAVDPEAPYGRAEDGAPLPLFPEEGGPPLEDKI